MIKYYRTARPNNNFQQHSNGGSNCCVTSATWPRYLAWGLIRWQIPAYQPAWVMYWSSRFSSWLHTTCHHILHLVALLNLWLNSFSLIIIMNFILCTRILSLNHLTDHSQFIQWIILFRLRLQNLAIPTSLILTKQNHKKRTTANKEFNLYGVETTEK